MSASLVGSEMCIRDSPNPARVLAVQARALRKPSEGAPRSCAGAPQSKRCLLYTSDAADDM
eukprot:12729305-Alexandrium_andersonii.AAC.1